MAIRIRCPINSGRTFGNQGPHARMTVPADSVSPEASCRETSDRPVRAPKAARSIRIVPPSSSKTRATDSIARRARTTPAPGSYSATPRLSYRIQGHRYVDLVRREHFVGSAQRVPVPACLREVLTGLLAQNDVPGLEEEPRQQPVAAGLVPRDPALGRTPRPAGPLRPVRPVAVRRAHPTGFAARGLPGIPRAIGVDHRHAGAETLQVQRRPHAERPGADDDHVG